MKIINVGAWNGERSRRKIVSELDMCIFHQEQQWEVLPCFWLKPELAYGYNFIIMLAKLLQHEVVKWQNKKNSNE